MKKHIINSTITLSKILHYIILVMAIFSTSYLFYLSFIPYKYSIGKGHYSPVIYNLEIFNLVELVNGIQFDIRYYKPKNREYCTYVNVVVKKSEEDLPVDLSDMVNFEQTKRSGWHIMRNFKIGDISNLDDVKIDVNHKCHPKYITWTKIFPNSYHWDLNNLNHHKKLTPTLIRAETF